MKNIYKDSNIISMRKLFILPVFLLIFFILCVNVHALNYSLPVGAGESCSQYDQIDYTTPYQYAQQLYNTSELWYLQGITFRSWFTIGPASQTFFWIGLYEGGTGSSGTLLQAKIFTFADVTINTSQWQNIYLSEVRKWDTTKNYWVVFKTSQHTNGDIWRICIGAEDEYTTGGSYASINGGSSWTYNGAQDHKMRINITTVKSTTNYSYDVGVFSSTEYDANGCILALPNTTVKLYSLYGDLLNTTIANETRQNVCSSGGTNYPASSFVQLYNLTAGYTYTIATNRTGYNPNNKTFTMPDNDAGTNIYMDKSNLTISRLDIYVKDSSTNVLIQDAQICVFNSNNTPAYNYLTSSQDCIWTSNIGKGSWLIDAKKYYYITVTAQNYTTNTSSVFLFTDSETRTIYITSFGGAGITDWSALLSANKQSVIDNEPINFSVLVTGSSGINTLYYYENPSTHLKISFITDNMNTNPFYFTNSLSFCGPNYVYVNVRNANYENRFSNNLTIYVNQPCSSVPSTPITLPPTVDTDIGVDGLTIKSSILWIVILGAVGIFGEYKAKSGGVIFVGVMIVGLILLAYNHIIPAWIPIIGGVLLALVFAYLGRKAVKGG